MQKLILPNGLRMIVFNKAVQTATLIVTVKTGSSNESLGEKGVSHFLEHILFEGTTTRTSIEITKAIEGIGGDIGAFTTNEETCFYIRVLPRHIDIAISILFDILVNPAFREKEIEKERKVILNEINLRRDEPRFFQWELFMRIIFPGTSLSFPVSGAAKSVSKLQKGDLIAYYKKYYSANNMILTYVGPSVNALGKLKPVFAGIKRSSSAPAGLTLPHFYGAKKSVTRSIGQSYLVHGYRTVIRRHKDSYVLDVIRSILGRGLSGSIVNEIRTVNGLAYEVACHHEANKDYGFFAVYLSTQKENLEKCKSIIIKHISLLRETFVADQELLEAKNYLEGELVRELEDSQRLAVALSIWDYCAVSTDVRKHIVAIRHVTANDVRRVATQYFNKNFALAILRQK